MIAYEVLVQTIADWKAGVRPTIPTPPTFAAQMRAPAGQPEVFEDYDSGVVDVGEPEAEWSEEVEVEAGEEAPAEWGEEQ